MARATWGRECDTIENARSFMNNPRNLATPEEGPAAPADENSFGDILQQFEQEHHTNGREAIQGTVVSITPETVFVDIGRKMDGTLPVDKVRTVEGDMAVRVGDTITVTVTGRDEDGSY